MHETLNYSSKKKPGCDKEVAPDWPSVSGALSLHRQAWAAARTRSASQAAIMSQAKEASLARWQKAGLAITAAALLIIGVSVWWSRAPSQALLKANPASADWAQTGPSPQQEVPTREETALVSENKEKHQRRLKSELDERWALYLHDIEEQGDDENWSGHPYDAFVLRQQK
jgi:hypothetical protein